MNIITGEVKLSRDLPRAIGQWTQQWIVRWLYIFAGFFVCLYGCTRTIKTKNKYGLAFQRHSPKYVAKGASGMWEYETFKDNWLYPWSNPEDGLLQEVNGKGSARCGGKERTFWNKYKWCAFRNPANYVSRETERFACDLRDLYSIAYIGDYQIDERKKKSWHFCVATTNDGRKYYGLRYQLKGKPRIHLGNKVKPEHIHGDDPDDLQKGTTFRMWGIDIILLLAGIGYGIYSIF